MYYCYRLNYNSTDNTYVNNSNVQVTAPGFGNTHTVEYMDEILGVRSFEYLNVFVSYFVTRGYVRGINITAAPYDWRLAAGTIYIISNPCTFVYTTCTHTDQMGKATMF